MLGFTRENVRLIVEPRIYVLASNSDVLDCSNRQKKVPPTRGNVIVYLIESMISRFNTADKVSGKKRECTCVSIKLDDRRNGDQGPPVVDIECSSHPGICVLDEDGVCTKRENAIHCADIPLKSLGGTLLNSKNETERKKSCCEGKSGSSNCNKVHYYKIDLNNSEDTGLAADKQCQTCGPDCSPATCSSRSREFFITWDKVRTNLFVTLVFIFVLWISIYSALSLTSNL